MKRVYSIVTAGVVLAGLLFLTPVHAEGLLYRLPEDGAFVKFEMEFSSNWKDEGEKTHKGTLTMSSVGEAKVDGKSCRWLEIKMEDQADLNHLAKVLILREKLKAGESPLDHAVKGWRKMREGGPKEITAFKTHDAGMLPLLLPGLLTDAKELPKKVIDSKLGKLECVGHTGKSAFEPNNEMKFDITYEAWINDKAPFGVVSARLKVKALKNGEEAGTWTMTLRLVEVGEGAKSALPDHE